MLERIPDGMAKLNGEWVPVEKVRPGGYADMVEHEGDVLLVVED